MNINFYDIESLSNVFSLANYKEKENNVEVFILCDDEILTSTPDFREKLVERIYQRNHNFNGTITLYDLHTEYGNRHLAKTFGLSNAGMVNNPDAHSDYPSEFRLVCDTDIGIYNPDIHPYLAGYNSYNYDTTMLALYLHEVFFLAQKEGGIKKCEFRPTTAQLMRNYNNDLFLPSYKEQMPTYLAVPDKNKPYDTNYTRIPWTIRKNMLLSGRHLDVARLNEKQSKVALKRLLGMLGFQILESNKLAQGQDHINNTDELYELIAYNVSDIINLKELFHHKLYQGQFSLKKGLLDKYPELIYQQKKDAYEPDISPQTVRRDRLYIDSSSAQLATKSLCPYGHLKDIETVSFKYPAEKKAKELGIKQVNVLDEARDFFYRLFPQEHLRKQFDNIYNYYKEIEGKNFNESKNYKEDYPFRANSVHSLKEIKNTTPVQNCIPYFDKNGNPTSCFVTFSTGGIHGAEYNKELFEYDMEIWEQQKEDFDYVVSIFPNPVDLRKAKTVTMPDGRELPYKLFLKSGKKVAESEYREIEKTRPQLFKVDEKAGGYKLNQNYVYTSSAEANHEDFTSYYPNLLRMMMAFYNEGLGYDRYAEIFDQKQEYGKYMKDKSRPEEERNHYSIMREGTKLILNSASGAGDANFESNIRMNNTIISMRIIGQLFSWRIGQAQAYAGANIISTNTDGLYSVMEATINNQILAKESADIGVEIEPEPLFLISKDTNNRIELDLDTNIITSASGGTLACRKGPNPGKSLAHPALIDWALSEYLVIAAQNYKGLSLDAPFDNTIGMNILTSAKHKFEPIQLLLMFQNVIASSPGSINYIFGTTDNAPETPIILSHYNRVFIMKNNTPDTMHLWAANAKVITDATKKKRKRDNNREIEIDPIAWHVLNANGVTKPPIGKDIVVKKVTGIGNDWYMLIQNKDLHQLTQSEYDFILNNLDYTKYLELLRDGFEKNWRNHLPGVTYEAVSDFEAEA